MTVRTLFLGEREFKYRNWTVKGYLSYWQEEGGFREIDHILKVVTRAGKELGVTWSMKDTLENILNPDCDDRREGFFDEDSDD